MKYVDLHLHTSYSDGTETPLQVVRAAKQNRLEMIAIADHDTLTGYHAAAEEAERRGIQLVPGVEITTIENHLLGLNFDPRDEGFAEFVRYSQDIQKGVCRQRVDVLRAHGVPISFAKVQRSFPDSSLGKLAILNTMLSDRECRCYLKERHERLTVLELLGIYLGDKGIAGHVEKKGNVVRWQQGIDAIHAAGGLAIFAHPAKKTGNPSEVLEMLRAVDGIEVQPRFGEENTPFKEYAERNGLLITYGSDYHSPSFGSPMLSRGVNIVDASLLGIIKK